MLRDLGDGLILRRATAADAESLADFNADQIRGQDAPEPFTPLGVWTRDLLTGRHPTFKPEDALIVEERKSGAIVSSLLRIDDLTAFVRAVGPTLERRLAASPLSGHTGDLTLSTYRAGARLAFTAGRLSAVAPWRPSLDVVGQEFGTPSTDPRRPMAMFPGLTVNQLLLGFRSLEELEGAFPDCMVRQGDGRALLDALFPKTPSDVWPLL